MFTRIRAAIAAFIYPEMIQTPTTDQTAENGITGGIHDQATAVQAQSMRDLHTGDTHHGAEYNNSQIHQGHGDQINNVSHGPVGFQAGTINDGIVNIGGNNHIRNTAFGHGATIHNG